MIHTSPPLSPYSIAALPSGVQDGIPFSPPSPSSTFSISAPSSKPGAPRPFYWSFSSFFFRESDVLQHRSSSYPRVFVLLTSSSFVFALVLSVSIRLSCNPDVLVASRMLGRRMTGSVVWLRFILQSMRLLLPFPHVFAALLYSYALEFNKRRRNSEERDGQPPSRYQPQPNIDLTRAAGWKQLGVEGWTDGKEAAVRVWRYFSHPWTTSSPAARLAVSELSEALREADQADSSSSGHCRASSCVLSVVDFVCFRLFLCPFYFLRWYVTPLSFRSVFYRLLLRSVVFSACYGWPINIDRAYGVQFYLDRLPDWLQRQGLDVDIAMGLSNGWPQFFVFQEAFFKCVDLLLLVVWCRPSKVKRRGAFDLQNNGWLQHLVPAEEAEQGEDEVDEQQQQQQQSLGAQKARAEAEECCEVRSDDSASVPSSASPSLLARAVAWLQRALTRRPSLLWLWVAFYASAVLLPALYELWVTLEWSRTITYAYWTWFGAYHKLILFSSLFPFLFIEHCIHVRGPEHARAFPESAIPWFQQCDTPHHGPSHGEQASPPHGEHAHAALPTCSCLLTRLLVLGVVASWYFNDMSSVLMNDYGGVMKDTSMWSYYDLTWRVLSFYCTVMAWKLAVRWVALGALPGATSVVPVFAIQLVEDVWSFLFFTSCAPFSPAFFFVCALHSVKTLGRDLNVPFHVACLLADRVNRLAVRRGGKVASSLPVSCMPAPGWRMTRKRNMMRHQNFLAFTCAKLIVLACFLADLLPASMGSYGVSTKLSQMERAGKIVAIVWVVAQQALIHWFTLRFVTWLTTKEREAATEQQQSAHHSTVEHDKSDQAGSIRVEKDDEKEFDFLAASQPVPITSPTGPRRRRALLSLSEFVDVHWRFHFVFFAVSVCRVVFDTTRFATAASHMPVEMYKDYRCIAT